MNKILKITLMYSLGIIFILTIVFIFTTPRLSDPIVTSIPSYEYPEELELVNSTPGNFNFLSSEIVINRGDVEKMFVKFENPTNNTIYNIFGGGDVKKYPTKNMFYYNVTRDGITNSENINLIMPPIDRINDLDTEVRMIEMTVDDSIEKGTYHVNFYWEINSTLKYREVVTVIVE